ncbi:MAG TPA: hypothetical protein VGB37_09495 [Candidatus Lokiarchaeia archaeon]
MSFLKTSTSKLGEWITRTKSGNTQEIISDMQKLNFREFKKKYKTSYKTSQSQEATLRRMKNEFEKAKLPFSRIWSEGYQKKIKKRQLEKKFAKQKIIKIRQRKKQKYKISKKTEFREIKKDFGGEYFREKESEQGNKVIRFNFSENLWATSIQLFRRSAENKLLEILAIMKNVWSFKENNNASLQQSFLVIKYKQIDLKTNVEIWMKRSIRSGIGTLRNQKIFTKLYFETKFDLLQQIADTKQRGSVTQIIYSVLYYNKIIF